MDYKAEKIKHISRKKDTPYDLFKKMRKIDREQHSFFYGTNPKRFVKQAKFMEGFTDNYRGNLLFEQSNPCYDQLSDAQLRTYFTWRTKVRNGIVKETSFSFLLMYIYELINNIGVKNSLDGIEKLIFLWKEYMKFSNELDEDIATWIKDYYICNDFNITFQEIVRKYEIESYYPNFMLSEDLTSNAYERLSGLSNYQFKDSKFYTAKNEMIIGYCFHETIFNLEPLLQLYGIDWEKILIGTVEKQSWWVPFQSAIYVDTTKENREVNISHCEHYSFENGFWTAYKPTEKTTVAGLIIGYIIKRIEAKLRIFIGHKHKLNPNHSALVGVIQKINGDDSNLDILVSDPMFDAIIDATTTICFKPEAEIVTLVEKLENKFKKMPYPVIKAMRTAKELTKAWSPAQRFYIQGKIACDLEDDVKVVSSFEEQVPTYFRMSNEQLRCYFTWRTGARKGIYGVVSEAYIKLYIFELINHIGVEDKFEVIKKMADILLHYKELHKSEEKLICNWLKDYYICGNFPCSFYDVISEYKIEQYYPNVALEHDDIAVFEVYAKMSSYKIEKSKFYKDNICSIVEGCLKVVLKNLDVYFKEHSVNLKKVLIGQGKCVNWWRPFSKAICYQNKMPKLKKIELCCNEVYFNVNGLWDSAILPEKNPLGTHLIGYILKRMESNLRVITKYKYKLSADVSDLVAKLISIDSNIEKAILNPDFEKIIDDTVLGYMKESIQPVEMTMDFSKLEKIRIEADETREKLTTEESEVEQENESEVEPELKRELEEYEQDAFKPQPKNPWQELYAELNETQIDVIKIILQGIDSENLLRNLSQGHQALSEVFFEEINEIALECIGDAIIETIEGIPHIYEEYKEQASNIFGGMKNGKTSTKKISNDYNEFT